MKRTIYLIAAFVALAIPGVASAHSGTVTCDSTGVVFTYNANFPANTLVTEHVGANNYTFTPPAFVVSTHTDPTPQLGGNRTVVASATWLGGGTIPPVTLICPATPPVCGPNNVDQFGNNCGVPIPVTPPARPTCPVGESEQSYTGGVLTCLITVTPPVPPTPVFTLCPKGDKSLGLIGGVQVCEKIKIKTRIVHKVTKIVRWVQWCPLPPKKTPGVAG